MNTYLITGGAGFIGSNFIHYLFEKYKSGIRIVNADCLTYAGNTENHRHLADCPNYRFERVNICDKDAVELIFKKYDIDYVVNFAAESHVDRSIHDAEIFVKTNVLGTQILLNIAKKYWETDNGFITGKKFIQVSTDEVYGSLSSEGLFTEDTPLCPHNPYSATKACADILVKSCYDTYGMPINITRCTNNYGPYQFPEKLIPLVINNCLCRKPIPLYGDGKNTRDWLYVEDHCSAIDAVITKGQIGEVYNIGGNNEKQNIEIIKTIIEELTALLQYTTERINAGEISIEYVEDRKGHDRRYAISADKIRENLNWEPQTSFKDGIKKTVVWYLQNRDWLTRAASADYQMYYEKMYENKKYRRDDK